MNVIKLCAAGIASSLLLAGHANAQLSTRGAEQAAAPTSRASTSQTPTTPASEGTQRRTDPGQGLQVQRATAIQDVTDKPPPPPPPPPTEVPQVRLAPQQGGEAARPTRAQRPD